MEGAFKGVFKGTFKGKFGRLSSLVNLRGESGAHEAPYVSRGTGGGNLSGAFRNSVGTL